MELKLQHDERATFKLSASSIKYKFDNRHTNRPILTFVSTGTSSIFSRNLDKHSLPFEISSISYTFIPYYKKATEAQ